jgi:hypothetical protein
VGRTATAVLSIDADPLVLLLATSGPGALDLNGSPILDVTAGKIHSNSPDACSINLVGTPAVSALVTSMVGAGCYPSGTITGSVVQGAPLIPDPLAGLLPDTAAWNAYKAGMPVRAGTGGGTIGGSGSFPPGSYSGGIDLKSSDTVTLQPGVYMLGGKGVTMKGGASLAGTGVTLLIDLNAHVDISGNAALSVAAPTTGPFRRGVRRAARHAVPGTASPHTSARPRRGSQRGRDRPAWHRRVALQEHHRLGGSAGIRRGLPRRGRTSQA